MSFNKSILTVALFMILTPILAAGCSTVNTKLINESVEAQVAYKIMQSNKDNPNFVILDIRTQEEFNSGHIAKATMIDYYLPDFKQKLSSLDRNKDYLIYCRTGHRTTDALLMMKSLGFRETYDIYGGINKWRAAGLPVVMN